VLPSPAGTHPSSFNLIITRFWFRTFGPRKHDEMRTGRRADGG